jgi:hypothetical protein
MSEAIMPVIFNEQLSDTAYVIGTPRSIVEDHQMVFLTPTDDQWRTGFGRLDADERVEL